MASWERLLRWRAPQPASPDVSPDVVSASGRVPFELKIFDQGDEWVDEAGRRYRLDDLSRSERRMLARWLRANARHFYAQVLHAELVRMLLVNAGTDPGGLGPAGDRAAEPGRQGVDGTGTLRSAAECGPFGLPELVFTSAREWLDATVLMRRLCRWWLP